MFVLYIFLILLIILVLGLLFAYRIAFFSPTAGRDLESNPPVGEQYEAVAEHIQRMSGIMRKMPYESVAISSFDGLTLSGRYYHVADHAPLEILFHGYRSHPYRDCSGGHALSRKMGFNALVVDQRSHGMSQGRTITFGIRERKDLLDWVRWANARFGEDNPIILSGLSMGAATVVMAADQPLPPNVCCIIADSPYSAPLEIIEKVAADQGYPPKLCRPFLRMAARIIGGFFLSESSALEAVTKTELPILLIHGEEDRFVPCDMSRSIASAGGDHVQLETFPGAGHGLCYITDPRRYEQVVFQFLDKIPAVSPWILPTFKTQLFDRN